MKSDLESILGTGRGDLENDVIVLCGTTADIIERFLPETGHEYQTVTLVGESIMDK